MFDLFEKIRDVIGCEFISDLKFGRNRLRAIHIIKDYSNHAQYSELCAYLNI